MPASVFFSYSHKDERLRDKLANHLSLLQRSQAISSWHDRKISAGTEWAGSIDQNLISADIILLLISADFLASDYCYEIELKQAMERHERGEARVIPIILRAVDWSSAPFAKLQALPTNAKPVTSWSDKDKAFDEIARGIRIVAQELETARPPSQVVSQQVVSQQAVSQPVAAMASTITADRHPPLVSPQASITALAASRPSGTAGVSPSENPEGTVPIGSPFYLESPYENRCYREMEKPGSLIRIKSPKKMGKTSLMARLLAHAEAVGYRSVSLNLQELNQGFLEDLDKFMQWFCASLGRQLGVRVKLEEYWDDIFGANDNSTDYVERYLLTQIEQPFVLAIDNFDRIFAYANIETDFCGLLRGWHERSRSNPLWGKIRLIIVYSQEPYLSRDINQSPFNVGVPVQLDAFTVDQLDSLINLHGFSWSQEQRQSFYDLVAGHPYLVRLGLYQLAISDLDFEEFMRKAPTEAGSFGEHLRRLLSVVEEQPALKEALSKVVDADEPVRLGSEEAFKLDSLGLVVRVDNEVQIRSPLYRQYFATRWLE